jgi:hypothetical protein
MDHLAIWHNTPNPTGLTAESINITANPSGWVNGAQNFRIAVYKPTEEVSLTAQTFAPYPSGNTQAETVDEHPVAVTGDYNFATAGTHSNTFEMNPSVFSIDREPIGLCHRYYTADFGTGVAHPQLYVGFDDVSGSIGEYQARAYAQNGNFNSGPQGALLPDHITKEDIQSLRGIYQI